MKKKSNAEQIGNHISKHGPTSVNVHEIPYTSFWLVATQTKVDTWKLYVCKPTSTTHRLVTRKATTTEYLNLWHSLIAVPIREKTITKTAAIYKKEVADYYKKLNKKQND